MAKQPTTTDYRRQIWDRLEDIPYPGEHEGLFGQTEALATLHHAFSSKRMHHAWLITGTRGIGKATTAFRFAAEILAEDPLDPDTLAETKRQIALGGHPNVLHITKPLNQDTGKYRTEITIEEIRKAKNFFSRTRGEETWRICIIDTADDLNNNATNALLKILEEPPAQTLFFILANFPGRLLPTIRSRCRRLNLKTLDQNDLFSALNQLNIQADQLSEPEKANLFQLSSGSVRRAIILLQLDGLALYNKFSSLIAPGQNGKQDWVEIHKLADDLSRANRLEHYRLLFDIAQGHVSDYIHQNASELALSASNGESSTEQNQQNKASTLSALARMCEVWEKTANSANIANAYNLDKKQVLLDMFRTLGQLNTQS